MKHFFKENFALVIGITLPLLLIILFFAAGQISQKTVADPRFDAVFATNYNKNAYNNPYDISVDNGNIIIKYKALKNTNQPIYQKPQLFIFDHESLNAVPLAIDFDQIKKGRIASEALDKLNKNKIDPARRSPDGYEFEYHYSGSGGIFGEFFGFGYRQRSRYVLKKDTRMIPVTGTAPYYNAHFIGWVIEDE